VYIHIYIYIQLLKVDEQWQNHGTVVAGQTAPFPMQVYLDLACVSWWCCSSATFWWFKRWCIHEIKNTKTWLEWISDEWISGEWISGDPSSHCDSSWAHQTVQHTFEWRHGRYCPTVCWAGVPIPSETENPTEPIEHRGKLFSYTCGSLLRLNIQNVYMNTFLNWNC